MLPRLKCQSNQRHCRQKGIHYPSGGFAYSEGSAKRMREQCSVQNLDSEAQSKR